MIIHDKLVRDKIPDIIRKNGSECEVKVLNRAGYSYMLEAKLKEELGEFLDSHSTDELADMLEVIFAIANDLGVSEPELCEIRRRKREERGGFVSRLLLVSTTD